MTLIKNSLLFKSVILLVLLLSISAVWYVGTQNSSPPQALVGVLRSMPVRLNSFELTDQNGQGVSEQIFKNKWSFVFFGYTSCPDICPATLYILDSVMAALAKKEASQSAKDVQVVFVSVDPERDTLAALADYMAFFNPDFIGMTGDKKNVDNMTRQFGAGYVIEEETAPGQYAVAHTSAVFLVTPDGELVAAFSQPHIPRTMVSQYEEIRTYLSK